MFSIITDTLLAVSRSTELTIFVKTTIILMLGLIVASFASRAQASLRHLIFSTTLAAVLVLPIIAITVPGLTVEVPVAKSTVSGERSVPARQTATASETAKDNHPLGESSKVSWLPPTAGTALLTIWGFGCLLLLAAFARDLWTIRLIRINGLPAVRLQELTRKIALESGIKRPIDVLVHEDVNSPVTYGFFRPVIIFPTNGVEWPADDLERAVVHEIEHVRRGDWVTQLLARTICIFYWVHPLVWVAWRQLCLEAERACDDAVVQKAASEEYAEQLVNLSQQIRDARMKPLLSMAKKSDLSRRVNALLDEDQRRGRSGSFAIIFALVVGSLAVVSIGPLRAVAKSKSGQTITQADMSDANATPNCALMTVRELVLAAQEGDTGEIKSLLSSGVDVNCKLAGDGSPLIVAARNGQVEAARLLLDRGADVNMAVKGDGNPLIMAAMEGNEEIVALLLKRDADVNRIVPGDENALINASARGHLRIVRLLVERGADLDMRIEVKIMNDAGAREFRTALSMARKGAHDEVASYLISKGATN